MNSRVLFFGGGNNICIFEFNRSKNIKSKYCKYNDDKFKLAISVGIKPLSSGLLFSNLLKIKIKTMKCESRVNYEFNCSVFYNLSNNVGRQISLGIVPVNWLLATSLLFNKKIK